MKSNARQKQGTGKATWMKPPRGKESTKTPSMLSNLNEDAETVGDEEYLSYAPGVPENLEAWEEPNDQK